MQIRDLTLEEEAPLKVLPDVPYFSENYAWHGYDHENRIGFYCHIGRWSEDRTLLREQMYVYLPDGTTTSYRSVGVGDCERGPEAGVQKQYCIAPGKHWRITHRGPSWHHRLEDLVKGRMLETFPQKLDLDIEFLADSPVFLYDSSNNLTWGRWHMEQLGRIKGRITFAGKTYQMNGLGFRDHTRGPRNLKDFFAHNWIQGKLPDGTGFALYELWDRKDGEVTKPLSKATLLYGDRIEEAEVLAAPAFDSFDDILAPIRISFRTASRRFDLEGEVQNNVLYSVDHQHNTLTGAARGYAPILCIEQPVKFMLDGQMVEGHCERCRRLTETEPALRIR
jgi:hypothetical protein